MLDVLDTSISLESSILKMLKAYLQYHDALALQDGVSLSPGVYETQMEVALSNLRQFEMPLEHLVDQSEFTSQWRSYTQSHDPKYVKPMTSRLDSLAYLVGHDFGEYAAYYCVDLAQSLAQAGLLSTTEVEPYAVAALKRLWVLEPARLQSVLDSDYFTLTLLQAPHSPSGFSMSI